MSESTAIERFLAAKQGAVFAVVGASRDRAKYGNKVLRAYQQRGLPAVPIHPTEPEIEGAKAFPAVIDVPQPIHAASIITPPAVTEKIVEELHARGVKHAWMQPGAESARAIDAARKHGMNVIAGGPCILVAFGYRE